MRAELFYVFCYKNYIAKHVDDFSSVKVLSIPDRSKAVVLV